LLGGFGYALLGRGVDARSDPAFHFIAFGSRIEERDLRIGAKRYLRLLAFVLTQRIAAFPPKFARKIGWAVVNRWSITSTLMYSW
jgi:hypothetical protein